MAEVAKERLQAYLPPEIAERIRKRAAVAERPESWELLRVIKLGLKAAGESFEERV